MADLATTAPAPVAGGKSLLDRKSKMPGWVSGAIVLVALIGGLGYIGFHVAGDLGSTNLGSTWPYILLGAALFIALGFEFVNGFHDTANAVATVIYTHSLDPNIAVVWSGLCNLTGVLLSAGTVAFSIITLLPVELILKVSSGAGFAMVFALLLAAILWNLGTWWLGLPASSTHTMTGSIIGVGVANQLMANSAQGTSGVDWEQATKVFRVLLISPLVGFGYAAVLFMILKPKTRAWGLLLCAPATAVACIFMFQLSWLGTILWSVGITAALWLAFKAIPTPDALFKAPESDQPPPFPIRVLLILTCTGVSYFHGSNDGQKGMGLIMLILIGTVPTAYALNHAVTAHDIQDFIAASEQAVSIIDRHVDKSAQLSDPREELTLYLQTKKIHPATMTALRELIRDTEGAVRSYGDYKAVPATMQSNVRNDMYVTSETLRVLAKNKQGGFSKDDNAALSNYKGKVDKATKFIPSWVKVAVALALGLGTMVGWKRIVVTVGEKIGKEHLTYGQGASAELVAMGTIWAADTFGMPVSTTHVLSSGVAGTMAANGSGLQLSTIRNIAAAWIFTLPAAALISGLLYWAFRLMEGN
jgi:PiT family inorganic phosphate transporter